MTKIAIFASGNGSNFEAIIKYFKGKNVDFACVTDNSNAYVLKRAKNLNIKSFIVSFEKTYDFLKENKFDLVVLAGYMRILPENILALSTFINIHPSLLPEFKGKNAIKRAYEAKAKETGVTIHYVTKEVDSGEIICQERLAIKENMTLEELENNIHKIEHEILPKTIEKLIQNKKYNVLVIGSGAREHAISEKIKESKLLNKLFLYGANDGFKDLGSTIPKLDSKQLTQNKIDIAIIGPEQPLAEGLVDYLEKNGIKCIGSNKYWSQLESSKSFAKKFMQKYDIATAKYVIIENLDDIKNIPFEFPYVIKADGLAMGKGVVIVYNYDEAQKTITEFLNGKYNEASKKIVVEEFIEGEELSLIALWDGKTLLPFPCARDYKKLYNDKSAPNTGGMGAICPVEAPQKEIENYIKKLNNALISENADFRGVIYSGLIKTKNSLKVLEFNMRFGDPETQVILNNIENDLLELFIKTLEQNLDKTQIISQKTESLCIVLASKGYPTNPIKGDKITIENLDDVKIYYAGVIKNENTLYTNGGRVLCLCATAKTLKIAKEKVYNSINKVNFENKIYREDILCSP